MADKIEVREWKYSRPKHIPEGVKELLHACGCREYEKDGVWYLNQCPAHKMETDSLIESLGKETTKG
jgi:hypothetical protein